MIKRSQSNIQLVVKHNRSNVSVFGGEPHIMAWTAKGTGFVSLSEMPDTKFNQYLEAAQRAEEKEQNEIFIVRIAKKYGAIGVTQTRQWRDSLKDIVQLFSMCVSSEIDMTLIKRELQDTLTFNHQR